jgi:hypothetical protein
MAIDAMVPLTTDGGRLSLYLACFLSALRVSGVTHPGSGDDADDEKLTEDRKFRFCSNNRGFNLSKRLKTALARVKV